MTIVAKIESTIMMIARLLGQKSQHHDLALPFHSFMNMFFECAPRWLVAAFVGGSTLTRERNLWASHPPGGACAKRLPAPRNDRRRETEERQGSSVGLKLSEFVLALMYTRVQ
jgi:hypothetical protein